MLPRKVHQHPQLHLPNKFHFISFPFLFLSPSRNPITNSFIPCEFLIHRNRNNAMERKKKNKQKLALNEHEQSKISQPMDFKKVLLDRIERIDLKIAEEMKRRTNNSKLTIPVNNNTLNFQQQLINPGGFMLRQMNE